MSPENWRNFDFFFSMEHSGVNLWIMKRKFKTVVFNNFTKINNTNIYILHLKQSNTKKTTIFGIGNPGPSLGQKQKSGRIKSINGIPLPLW